MARHVSWRAGGEARRAHTPADLGDPAAMLAVSAARLVETNRIGPLPAEPLMAKVRSLAKPVPVTLDGVPGDGAAVTIRFANPEYGVAPGQAAVLYAGDRVVGGGWIDSTEPAEIGAA